MNLNPLPLLILLTTFTCLWPTEATAARFITADVSYDGKVILRGSTSDDGRTDADGVWAALKTMKFRSTEAFKALKIDPAAKKTVLLGCGPSVALENSKVVISIDYGGSSTFRELSLIRVPKDASEREWILAPAEIDEMFAYRTISRREASKLLKPKQLKP